MHPPSSPPCASLVSYVLPAQAVASDESLPTVMRWLSREGGAVLSRHGSQASATAARAGLSQDNHGRGADIAGNLMLWVVVLTMLIVRVVRVVMWTTVTAAMAVPTTMM